MNESRRLRVPHARTVRVAPASEAQMPPIPDRKAIDQWMEAYDRTKGKNPGPQPAGMGAGHYQALVLDLQEGVLRFHCDDWRQDRDARTYHGGAELWLWQGPDAVPTSMYWTIDSGVRQLPYLTAEQGNALAERVAPVAQELLENLVEVPGTDEVDWSPEAFRAAQEMDRLVQREPDAEQPAPVVVSLAEVYEALPDWIERRWADWTARQLDEQAPHLTRTLGLNPDRELIAEALGIELGQDQRLLVVGTRAWLYGYRREMASGRTPMELERWWATSGRESLVSADSSERDLVHLAEREQRAATEDGVLLVDAVPAMRAERARLRSRLVRELEVVLGPRRVEAMKESKLAQAAVSARLDQILAWADPGHANYAALGRAAGMTRQAVQAKADALKADQGDEDEADPWSSVVGSAAAEAGAVELQPGHADGVHWRCVVCKTTNPIDREACEGCERSRPPLYAGKRRYSITCPRCGSVDVEEYGEPIPNTDDFADCARCNGCGDSWGLDPGADASCTRCGGSGIPGAGPVVAKKKGEWERVPSCECVPS
ncbi:hypothetical protein ACPC54_40510 [Kitasatospora sp. NPDC094028]